MDSFRNQQLLLWELNRGFIIRETTSLGIPIQQATILSKLKLGLRGNHSQKPKDPGSSLCRGLGSAPVLEINA